MCSAPCAWILIEVEVDEANLANSPSRVRFSYKQVTREKALAIRPKYASFCGNFRQHQNSAAYERRRKKGMGNGIAALGRGGPIVQSDLPEEHALERAAAHAAGIQDRVHLCDGMDKDAERVAAEGLEEVDKADGKARVPDLTRIRHDKDVTASPGSRAEKRAEIGVAADDAVESDDVCSWQRGGYVGKVRLNESNLVGMAEARSFVLGSAEIGTGGIDVGGSAGGISQQVMVNGAYAAANIQKRGAVEAAGAHDAQDLFGLCGRAALAILLEAGASIGFAEGVICNLAAVAGHVTPS